MPHPPPTHAKPAKTPRPASADEAPDPATLRLKLMHAVPEHCPQAIYTSVPQRAHGEAEHARWFSASEAARPGSRRASRTRTRSMDAKERPRERGAAAGATALPITMGKGSAAHSGSFGESGRYPAHGEVSADVDACAAVLRSLSAAGSRMLEAEEAGLKSGRGDAEGERRVKRRRFVIPDSEDDEDAVEEVEKGRGKERREEEARESEVREKSKAVCGTDGRWRYVVLSWKDWSLQEVDDERAAMKVTKQHNPGIDAGNGVMLYVNDAPDRGLHRGLQEDQSSINYIADLEEEFQLPHTYNHLRLAGESSRRFRRELEIPDDVPEGSPLYYVIWLAVERLRTAERSLDGA
ncbi:hypothetical protein W97_02631 [Coniosporium apollinis CBS 100218]|uniref:Uncharacterized protein n=1 Tax=Coniosporium apollinis (strain CBS 100218) TaxID=1168221 RepID=R7YNL3_CONA1|nr:uncharacterized protein W97_02631 [Coniosporium apollinis CBS 100218]EON63404.1 hypothetical protein W97_02631 [Coniosporium apollinis CBS 100218]